MTLAEFKAWFEGFTEDMDGEPNAKQWKRIKDRVKKIDGTAITREVVYRDRYWRDYWSAPLINDPLRVYCTNTAQTGGLADAVSNVSMPAIGETDLSALGRAEYSSTLA